jgi:hypothetical protein
MNGEVNSFFTRAIPGVTTGPTQASFSFKTQDKTNTVMILRHLAFLLLLVATPFCRAQVALNPGDVWIGAFSTVPFFSASSGGFSHASSGGLELSFSSFPSGTVKFELYEGSPVGPPAASGLVNGGGPGGGFVGGAGNLWQDLAGTVRLTMLTGQCVVSVVSVVIKRPTGPNSSDNFRGNLGLTSAPPALAVQRLPSDQAVSWWTNGSTGYVLETANNLPTNQWSVVPAAPVIVSNRYMVNVGTNASAAYSRLRK